MLIQTPTMSSAALIAQQSVSERSLRLKEGQNTVSLPG